MSFPTTTVRIKTTPTGKPPLHIREQLVGSIMEIRGAIDEEEASEAFLKRLECCGAIVNAAVFLRSIAHCKQEVRAWFLVNLPDLDHDLIFRADELEVVSGPQCILSGPVNHRLGLLELGVGAHDQ